MTNQPLALPTFKISKLGQGDNFLVFSFRNVTEQQLQNIVNQAQELEFNVKMLLEDSIALELASEDMFTKKSDSEVIKELGEIFTNNLLTAELVQTNEAYTENIDQTNKEIKEFLTSKGIDTDVCNYVVSRNNYEFNGDVERDNLTKEISAIIGNEFKNKVVSNTKNLLNEAEGNGVLELIIPFVDSQLKSDVYEKMQELSTHHDGQDFEVKLDLVLAIEHAIQNYKQKIAQESVFTRKIDMLNQLLENKDVTLEEIKELAISEEEILEEIMMIPTNKATIKSIAVLFNQAIEKAVTSAENNDKIPMFLVLTSISKKLPVKLTKTYLINLVSHGLNLHGLEVLSSVLKRNFDLSYHLTVADVQVGVSQEQDDTDGDCEKDCPCVCEEGLDECDGTCDL